MIFIRCVLKLHATRLALNTAAVLRPISVECRLWSAFVEAVDLCKECLFTISAGVFSLGKCMVATVCLSTAALSNSDTKFLLYLCV